MVRFLVSLFLCLSLPLHAEDIQPDFVQMRKDLYFNMEFFTIVQKVGKNIDNKMGGLAPSEISDTKMAEILREELKHFVELYEKEVSIPNSHKGKFKKMMGHLKFSNVWLRLKSGLIGVHGFFKKRGIGMALGLGLGLICEYTVPIVLGAMGLPQLIPFSLMTPWGTIYSTVPGVTNRLRLRKRLINELGSKKAYLAYQEQMKVMMKEIKMSHPDQILYPIRSVGNINQALVVSKNSLWSSVLTKLGLNPGNLNSTSLKIFLLRNSISDPYIDKIRKTNSFPKYIKTALIADHIMLTADEEIKTKFKSQFHKAFTTMERPIGMDSKTFFFAQYKENSRTPNRATA